MHGWPGTEHQTLVDELALALIAAERRDGRAIDRRSLARSIHISPSSLYAYLNGTTLPPADVLDRLLAKVGIAADVAGRLRYLRDRVEISRRARRHRGARAASVPRQVPAAMPVVGRVGELAAVRGLLDTPPRIVTIDGTAGVGKTTLAVHVANGVAEQFPDGQLYADLNGFADVEPADPAETLLGFIVALGVPARAVPADIVARSALYRRCLVGRRVLVVLDNGRTAEQIRPLLPNQPGCATIVTSRHRLDELNVREGARRVELGLPRADEARELLAAGLPVGWTMTESEAADDLVALCGRLPLAVSLASAYTRGKEGAPLRSIVQDLRTAHGAFDLSAAAADIDVRRVFRWSYEAIPHAAQRLFRRLGLHPGPSVDQDGCAALLGDATEAHAATAVLREANMLGVRQSGRFHLHDLLRAYAVERMTDDPPAERHGAVVRMLDHYLGSATEARELIQPTTTSTATTGLTFADYRDAIAWFAEEIGTLRRLVPLAMRYGLDEHAWRLAWTCAVFLRRTARHRERAEMQQTALLAAERSGSRLVRATTLRLLADALNRIGSGAESFELLKQSCQLCEEAQDSDGIRQAHLSMVRVLDLQARHPEAFDHATQALRLAEPDDAAAVADGYTALAKQQLRLGRLADALVSGAGAAERYRRLQNREGLADILSTMGRAELGLGRHGAALMYLGEAVELDMALGDAYWAARTLTGMAEAYEAAGDLPRAAECRDATLRLSDSRPW